MLTLVLSGSLTRRPVATSKLRSGVRAEARRSSLRASVIVLFAAGRVEEKQKERGRETVSI